MYILLQTKLQDLLALSSAFLSSLGIVNYYKVSWGISPSLCILQREMELLDPNIQSTLNHPIHFQLCYPHDLCLQHWWLMRNAGQALAIWAYNGSPHSCLLLSKPWVIFPILGWMGTVIASNFQIDLWKICTIYSFPLFCSVSLSRYVSFFSFLNSVLVFLFLFLSVSPVDGWMPLNTHVYC